MTADSLIFKPVERINCFDFCKAKDPIDLLIEGYRALHSHDWTHCIANKSNLNECVYGCIINRHGSRLRSCHSHQKRIDKGVLEQCYKSLEQAFSHNKTELNSFEDLFLLVEKHRPKSDFKQICTYDTALRIAASTRSESLMPDKYVYLHCGALSGAQYLWKIDQLYRNLNKRSHKPYINIKDYPIRDCKVRKADFSENFQKMSSAEIEDFLCVCDDLLKGLYLQKASEM